MSKRKRNRGARRITGIAAIEEAEPANAPDPVPSADEDPLAFALRIMRDERKPMALRAGMAKAAMTALQKRDGDAAFAPAEAEPPRPELSNMERARRIAHILGRAHDELRARELAAQGWDVETRGMPVDNTDWPLILRRIMNILDSCETPPQNLDRAGIRV